MNEELEQFAQEIAAIARKPVQDIGRMLTEVITILDRMEQDAAAELKSARDVDETFSAMLTQAYTRGGRTVCQMIRDAVYTGLHA